jgi:fructokinase
MKKKIPAQDPKANPRCRTIVGIGEALWDLLPNERHIGGAPLNFSYVCSLLGERALVLSRIGNDALGNELIHEMSRRDVDMSCVQQDAALPTGTAAVALSADGQPVFEIRQPAAWDAFELTAAWDRMAEQADAVCFGTLAQRSAQSRATIRAFLGKIRSGCIAIFDVNLRSPFYSREVIVDSLEMATIAKFNETEFDEVASMVGLSGAVTPENLQTFARRFELDLVCATRGSRGSLLANPFEAFEHPGFSVDIRDTIGAGDAFAAAVAHCWLSKADLEQTSDIANRWAAWVASRPGGMPLIDEASRNQLPLAREPV